MFGIPSNFMSWIDNINCDIHSIGQEYVIQRIYVKLYLYSRNKWWMKIYRISFWYILIQNSVSIGESGKQKSLSDSQNAASIKLFMSKLSFSDLVFEYISFWMIFKIQEFYEILYIIDMIHEFHKYSFKAPYLSSNVDNWNTWKVYILIITVVRGCITTNFC